MKKGLGVAEDLGQPAVSFGETAGDYGRYRKPYPAVVFERLAELGFGQSGQEIVDLGTGTGYLARGLARAGATVHGVDPSERLIAEARRLDGATGVETDYSLGTAEATGLPSSRFDRATAAQCWHWFNSVAAAQECLRLLRAGGKLAIIHFDWLPQAGNVVAKTETLIKQHNPTWKLGGGNGLYPRYYEDLSEAGFVELESFTLDVDVLYDHESWRGRIRASAGVGASLGRDDILAFDANLAHLLARRFPEEPMAIPHRMFCLVGKKEP